MSEIQAQDASSTKPIRQSDLWNLDPRPLRPPIDDSQLERLNRAAGTASTNLKPPAFVPLPRARICWQTPLAFRSSPRALQRLLTHRWAEALHIVWPFAWDVNHVALLQDALDGRRLLEIRKFLLTVCRVGCHSKRSRSRRTLSPHTPLLSSSAPLLF